MKAAPWIAFAVAATTAAAVVAGFAYLVWDGLTADQRAAMATIAAPRAGIGMLAILMLLSLLALGIHTLFRLYVTPLRPLAEQVRLIAGSNRKWRLGTDGARNVAHLAASINVLAERHERLHDEMDVRIREANAVVEEEKGILEALVAKLAQGVIVCNRDDRIILYNARARALLQGSDGGPLSGDWIGLGRSLRSVLDPRRLDRALADVQRHRARSDAEVMVPFLVPRAGQRLLSAHLVPIVGQGGDSHGYLVTLEDIERKFEAAARRDALIQDLVESQRAATAGVRAAIENILRFPDMEDGDRTTFLAAIRDDALRMSDHISRFAEAYGPTADSFWPLIDVAGSDLLADLHSGLREFKDSDIEVTAPLVPVWVRADTFTLVDSFQFLVDQLIGACGADALALTLEDKGSVVALLLEWTGPALHPEALKSWGSRTVSTDWRGQPVSLFDVVEHHGAAIWSLPEGTSRRPRVQLVLPSAVGEAEAAAGSASQHFAMQMIGPAARTNDIETTPLDQACCTILDLETTGLTPSQGDDIIAVGAVRLLNGRVLSREVFDTFVRPRVPISEASRAVHGISMDMVRGAPAMEEVAPRLFRFVEDSVIVGHNVAFDMRFLEVSTSRTGVHFDNPVLDTLLLDCVVHPNVEDKTLEAIAARLGVNVRGRHTALGDALTTAGVFVALLPLLAERGIRTVAEARAASLDTPYARQRY
jgi:DNA polymerase-3 subunit epsilon